MGNSIFWYDYETTGINTRADRVMQVAGVRTDEALNEIGDPFSYYVRLDDDILPHPAAVQVTGIGPGVLEREGVNEAFMLARLREQLMQPGTCMAGYNNIRFDDEMTRFSFYRNFHDPYAHEWQNGNSRWDLLDALRCAHALRPEGINWPANERGRTSFRLELLTAANGIDHGQAHDALVDVRATIGMARLLRQAQPRLYDFLYANRGKHAAGDLLRPGQPVVHVSGRLSARHANLSVVMMLDRHPRNGNAVIVCDLLADVSPLLELDAQTLKQRLYTRHDQLAEGELPVPLKLVHLNRCPVLAPLSVLREQDCQRLEIEPTDWQAARQQLLAELPRLQQLLAEVYAEDDFPAVADPEQGLYGGFLSPADRRMADKVVEAAPEELNGLITPFTEPALNDLLFRYRARTSVRHLTVAEQQQWQAFCQRRLTGQAAGAPVTLTEFMQACNELEQSGQGSPLLDDWKLYVQQRMQRLGLPAEVESSVSAE